MNIRKANLNDLNSIMNIYANARSFMEQNGNSTQWGKTYPSEELIKKDLENNLHVCIHENSIACVFYYACENDPTYATIYNGNWRNNEPYAVVHRVASSHIVKGAAKFSLEWAFSQTGNVRIDTHKNNIPMQNLLKNLGFQYCGIIYLENGEERLAYQKIE